MIEPHAPTIFLVVVAVNVTLTIALAAGGSATHRDGLWLWSIALALHTLAFVSFGLGDDFTLILVAATTLSASWAMFAEGLFQFQQRIPPRGLIWLAVLLIPTVFFLFQDHIPLRISLVSAIFCAQTLLILVVLNQGRQSTAGRGQYFIAVGLVPVIPVFAFRGFLAATGQADQVLMSAPTQVQALSFLVSIVATLLVAIGLLIMSKERLEARSRLLSVQDQLTGLANRRRIDETLSREWARAHRHGGPLALIMLDIDFFKKYNDHYGHQAGDECLKSVALTLQESVQRASDLVARYGGEEFLLILPDTDAVSAQRLAESLCVSIAELKIPHAQSSLRVVTLSAGIATLTHNAYKDVDSLLRAADAALYQAKHNGRNQARPAPDSAARGGPDKQLPGDFVQLSWHAAYECGDPLIDEQHRALFTQTNKLLSAMLDGNTDTIGDLLDALIENVVRHFQDEEAIITSAGFPASAEHLATHRQLIERAFELVNLFHAGRLGIGELFQFLAHDLVARHILGSDREYIPYLAGNPDGIQPHPSDTGREEVVT